MLTAKIGDKINAHGITVTIAKILYQEYYYDRWENSDDWDIELIDENGNYRHWRTWVDGGKLIPC